MTFAQQQTGLMPAHGLNAGFVSSPFFRKAFVVLAMLFCLIYLFTSWSSSPAVFAADNSFFVFFDAITRKSWAFDTLIVDIFMTNTIKLFPILLVAVWLLFEHKNGGKRISFFGCILAGSFISMIISRVMQNFSAHRPRPLHNPSIDYQLPFGIQDSVLKGWSSFPSDTSALAFSIVAGIFMASTRLGLAALAWAVMVVSFPRAYAGLHYPSDLLGGALIGFLCTICAVPVVQYLAVSKQVTAIPVKWHPLLWALAFFYLFQMGTMFNDIRAYGSYAKTVFGF